LAARQPTRQTVTAGGGDIVEDPSGEDLGADPAKAHLEFGQPVEQWYGRRSRGGH
jgi:hypothetical protein